jgi:hypothetical protein
MFRLVADIHFSDIGSLYWEKLQLHAPCGILRMSIDGVSTIFGFASWLIYVLIGCRHPFIKYWQPLLAKQQRNAPCHILKMSVNGASTVLVVSYLVIKSLH